MDIAEIIFSIAIGFFMAIVLIIGTPFICAGCAVIGVCGLIMLPFFILGALCIISGALIVDMTKSMPETPPPLPPDMSASTYETIAYNVSRVLDMVHMNPTKDNALVQRYFNVTVHVQHAYVPSYVTRIVVCMVLAGILYVVCTSKSHVDTTNNQERQPILPADVSE